jgi:glycosyltransferase involved in cell wall biosynthesis
MKFAVDAHAIGRHLTGNEVYIRSLLNSFPAVDRENEFLAYVSSDEAARSLPSRVRIRQIAPNPYLRLGFDLAMKLRRDRPDLLHVQYTAPVACPVPVVVSVHDVSFLERPEYFTRARALQLRFTVRRTVRRAARVLTPSEFARTSVLRAYPELDPENVLAIPNAAGGSFRPVSREQATAHTRQKFGVRGPFVLNVGDLQPRKNQIGLIQAFADLMRSRPQLQHRLVLAGKETWFAPKVKEAAAASGFGDRIHFPGFVDDLDLLHLYNACDMFVFPSHYEGFGIPILEAMACGRAVACSSSTSMREVADGAALVFDPESKDEICRAICDLLIDPQLRARMERLGLQRAAHFSWQKSAEQTLAVYRSAVEAGAAAQRQTAAQPVRRS